LEDLSLTYDKDYFLSMELVPFMKYQSTEPGFFMIKIAAMNFA